MVERTVRILVVATLAVIAAACQNSSAETTTTTTSALVELPPAPTTTVGPTTTTLAPIDELSAPEYQIVRRIPGDGVGDELVVLLDPTSYDTLTDIDIQDLMAEVVEFFPPVWTMHVVDDQVAVTVVIDPEATEEALAEVEDHYLAVLTNGVEITYLGPFAESGSGVLGS